MKNYLFFVSFTSIILFGCGTTNLYQTPPLYFGSSHFVPEGDSSKCLTGNVSFVTPNAAELKIVYRINKSFLTGISYHGNLGKYSDYSNNGISYRFNTTSFDIYSGFSKHWDKKSGLFVMAGYGWGSNTSIVPEYDNSEQFIYQGRFRRFTAIPGIDVATGQRTKLIFSWRESLIQFQKYELPDTTYFHKQQFLSDMMLRFSLKGNKTGFNIFSGSFLNGSGGADRQRDPKPDQWKIESFFAGIGITYEFAGKKNKK